MHSPALITFFLFGLSASAGTLADSRAACRCSIGLASQVVERPQTYFASTTDFFPTASTFKLPISVAFLGLVDSGKFRLDQKLSVIPSDLQPGVSPIADAHPHGGELIASDVVAVMIAQSDNSAANAMIRICGGPARVTALLRERGLDGIDVAGDEHGMDDRRSFLADRATPGAMVKLLVRLYSGKLLSPASTAFLIHALEQTTTGPTRIKGMLPPGTVVGHKTGTGGRHGGVEWAINDVGVITLPGSRGHLALAVFVQDSHLSAAATERLIARLAKEAYDQASR